MNFSCSGTITDIRMRMDFIEGVSVWTNIERQEVHVYFLLFHDRLNSSTRRVTYILFNQGSTFQYNDLMSRGLTQIWQNTNSLALRVTEETFIGFAVPENRSEFVFTQTINLSPASERVETHIYQLAANFSVFEGKVLEAARTADSSQFTTQMIAPPLIDISVSK